MTHADKATMTISDPPVIRAKSHAHQWDEIFVAWAAGIIEGEGCILTLQKEYDGNPYPVFRIAVNMTDRDVVEKLHRGFGCGKFNGPCFHSNPRFKPYFRWLVHKRDCVYAIAKAIRPHMGLRRGERIDAVIAEWELSKRPGWSHGTRHAYETLGCRCHLCRGSNAARRRAWVAKRKNK